MSKRKYTHIKVFEKEILEMKKSGKTKREIAETIGLEVEQIKEFLKRHRRKERKMIAGIIVRSQGRSRKDSAPRNIIAEQAYEIKRLKMENELLRDFLSLIERKGKPASSIKLSTAIKRNITSVKCVVSLVYPEASTILCQTYGYADKGSTFSHANKRMTS